MPLVALLALATVALAAAPAALAAPADDARAAFEDWRQDGRVTPCRFSRTQLANAQAVVGADFDSYAPGFGEALRQEIARHDAGGCRGVAPLSSARSRSALRRVRITAIRPRGGLRESITIRNSGPRGVSLRGATLRDRSGRRLRLGSGRLAPRRSLRVYTGCASGRRRAHRRGALLYACQRRQVWNDRGDVVKVVDSRRVTVAQRGYGSLRNVVRF